MADKNRAEEPAIVLRREGRDAANAIAPSALAALASTTCLPTAAAMEHPKRTCAPAARDRAARLFLAGTPHNRNLTPQARTFVGNIISLALPHWPRTQAGSGMLFRFVAGACSRCVADAGAALGAAAGTGSDIIDYALRSVRDRLSSVLSYCCYPASLLMLKVSVRLRRDRGKPVFPFRNSRSKKNTLPLLRKEIITIQHPAIGSTGLSPKKICALLYRNVSSTQSAWPRTSAILRWLVSLLSLAYLSCCEPAFSVPHHNNRGPPHLHRHAHKPACIYMPGTALSGPQSFPRPPTAIPVVTPVVASQPSYGVARATGAPQRLYTASERVLAPLRGRPLRASTLLQQQQQHRTALQYQQCHGSGQTRTQVDFGRNAAMISAPGYVYTHFYGRNNPVGARGVPSFAQHQAVHLENFSEHLRNAGSAPMRSEFPAIYDRHNVPITGPLPYTTTSAFPVSAPTTAYIGVPYYGTPNAQECLDCEQKCVPIISGVRHAQRTYPYATRPVAPFRTGWHCRGGFHPGDWQPNDPRHVSPRIHLSGRIIHRRPSVSATPSLASTPRGRASRSISRTSHTGSSIRATSCSSAPLVRPRSRTAASAQVPRSVAVSSDRPSAPRSSVDFPRRRKILVPSHLSAPPSAHYHVVASTPRTIVTSAHHPRAPDPGLPVYTGVLPEQGYAVAPPASVEKRGGAAELTSSQRRSRGPPVDRAFVKRFGASALRAEREAAQASAECEERGSSLREEKQGGGGLTPAVREERRQQEQERQWEKKRGGILSVRLDRGRSHQSPGIQVEPLVEEEEEDVEPDEEPEEELEEEEEEELEEPEYPEDEEEEELEEDEDEEERNHLQMRDKMHRQSKGFSLVVHPPVKDTEWDYSKMGEDWKIGRGHCASQERQSPINFDETQPPLSMEEADALQQQWRDQERRRTRNEAMLKLARHRKDAHGRRSLRSSGSSWAQRRSPFWKTLMIDAKHDETKLLQLRLGTNINRYLVKLVPEKKVEFEPEKHLFDISNGTSKKRQLMSSFGFVRTGGKIYDVINIHFHAPAEHTFNMQRRALELHIVCEHTASDLVVLGLTFEGVDHDAVAGALTDKKVPPPAFSAPRAVSRAARANEKPMRRDGVHMELPFSAVDGVAAAAAAAGGVNKKKTARKHGVASTKKKRAKRGAAVLTHSKEDKAVARAESSIPNRKEHAAVSKAENTGEKKLQVQEGHKAAATPAKLAEEKADAIKRGDKTGEEETTVERLISPGAHDFMAAVTEAIRLTREAEQKTKRAREDDRRSTMERWRQEEAEENLEEFAAAAAPRRRLEHDDEEEREPFHSSGLRGRPWIFTQHVQDYPKESRGPWGPWAAFDSCSTTFTSEESVMSSEKNSFPLLRTLPSGHAAADAQQARQVQGRSENREDDEEDKGQGPEGLLRKDRSRGPTTVATAEHDMRDEYATTSVAGQRKESKKRTKVHRRRRTIIEAEGEDLLLPPINLQALLAGEPRTFYRYNGSLTTPPCSETVLW